MLTAVGVINHYVKKESDFSEAVESFEDKLILLSSESLFSEIEMRNFFESTVVDLNDWVSLMKSPEMNEAKLEYFQWFGYSRLIRETQKPLRKALTFAFEDFGVKRSFDLLTLNDIKSAVDDLIDASGLSKPTELTTKRCVGYLNHVAVERLSTKIMSHTLDQFERYLRSYLKEQSN